MSSTAPAGPSTSTSKQKTKSKQRYLKRKKERRKHRPKTATGNQDEQSDTDNEETEKTRDDVDDTIVDQAVEEQEPEHVTKTPDRPKKRPRLDEDEDVEMLEEENIEADEIDVSQEKPSTPEVLPALPSFPLPAHPNAPSKSVLALQGLDEALLGAELVSPSTTLSIPLGKDDGGTRLSERMRKRLRDLGITELFAVQTALLPFLIPSDTSSQLYLPYNPPRDVCVSAPTGSGKTLAYALPIIELLSTRVVTRLRALIVLPTRDLVSQVRETMEALCKGTKLKIGTATGQHSFSHEQSQLIQDQTSRLKGGSSKVDILICTPGRLIDHLVGTPNFTLQHLRFLVVDEADRLLAQSFQDWLAQVLAATRFQPQASVEDFPVPQSNQESCILDSHIPDGLSPTFLNEYSTIPSFFTEEKASSCQKLLFSATLTRDPGKISALELRDPKYFLVQETNKDRLEPDAMDVVMEKFSMPSTLKEYMLVCDSSQKPLNFFHLVHTYHIRNALVFTKSAESTIRLVRLFEFFEKEKSGQSTSESLVIRAYSSDLAPQERKMILEQFKNQKINILVCSDLISRGIDISHVSHVVSYDVPVDMRKYVHRVGRTARAGREGDAWTLVEQQEARYFKQMLKDTEHLERVKRLRVSEKDLAPLLPLYEAALNHLKELYSRQN